jgi:hypothetical protein
LESVFVVGDIPNAACGTFYRGYVTDADTIDLSNSFNWADMEAKAKGTATGGSACERRGSVGIYIDLPAVHVLKDPLGLNAQASPNAGVLLFDRFDFHNATLDAPDTVITYNGNPVFNTVTGLHLRASQFNGIVFFERDANVKGALTLGNKIDGVSARNLTVFATRYIIVRGDIITGHTGFDPVTRAANQSGDPANIGLVAESQIQIPVGVRRVLRIDAALLSRTSNWAALGSQTTADHPSAAPGPLDLDLDELIETPHNNDPAAGEGWDEQTITVNTWVLNITGPIITNVGGSAGPWVGTPSPLGPTRRYNYDMDMTEFPPPCFPVPLNLYKDVSWTEIFEVSTPLASHLHN